MFDWFFMALFFFYRKTQINDKYNQNETYSVNDNIITELQKKSTQINITTCIKLSIKTVSFINYLLQFLI